MKLQAGRYFAGVNIPMLVPNSLVIGELENKGARNVQIFDRDEMPKLSFDPKVVDKSYSDDWDELIVFDYAGPDKEVDITKMWAWLVRIPASSPAAKQPILASPTSQSTETVLRTTQRNAVFLTLGGLALIIGGLVGESVRKR